MIEPVLAAWRGRRRAGALDIGRPPEHDLRTIMDAILYVDRTGIPWRYLSHDYPPWQTVYGYFRTWRDTGIFTELSGLLHRLVRVHQGRPAEPSAAVIDAQSVKTSGNVPSADQASTPPRRSPAANAASWSTPSACWWRSWSPPPSKIRPPGPS